MCALSNISVAMCGPTAATTTAAPLQSCIAQAAGIAPARVLLQSVADADALPCGSTATATGSSCCCTSAVAVNFYLSADNYDEAAALNRAFVSQTLLTSGGFTGCLQVSLI